MARGAATGVNLKPPHDHGLQRMRPHGEHHDPACVERDRILSRRVQHKLVDLKRQRAGTVGLVKRLGMGSHVVTALDLVVLAPVWDKMKLQPYIEFCLPETAHSNAGGKLATSLPSDLVASHMHAGR